MGKYMNYIHNMQYTFENFLIITLDSCRWDTYLSAHTPTLDSILKFKKAYAQGTYTLPSHISMYSGIFPNVNEEIPLYNRFKRDLFRINIRPVLNDPYVMLPKETFNIITGLSAMGYKTYGTGAVGWFKHPLLNQYFNEFLFTGIDFASQIDFILNCIKSNDNPFFAFINAGETHEPYKFGEKVKEVNFARNRMRSFSDIGYLKNEHEQQIAALEYIDNKLEVFFNNITKISKRKTTTIICSDHGECFGEDGLYGHGFFHEKIMEIPLGIFRI